MALRTNFSRFKEPRGFIKILQFFIAILAFATTGGYYNEFKFQVTAPCPSNATKIGTHNELIKFGYPFNNIEYNIDGVSTCSKSKHEQNSLNHNYKSESEFFVFVGVISFLYCVVALAYYIAFEDPAKYGPGGSDRVLLSFATADFVITVVLAVFWFAASVAWAAGLPKLKDSTDADKFIKGAAECNKVNANCKVLNSAGYAALTISVLFGFLSCFLWCANIWFVYKETVWHKEPGVTATAEQPNTEIPHQELPKEEAIP